MTKFVYFDVGGVVVKDFSGTNKWRELESDIGIKPEQNKKFEDFFFPLEDKVSLGMDLRETIPLIEKEFKIKFPKDYSFLEDFVRRFEKNESIWPIIQKAKKKYKIGLLTNMYPNMLELIYKSKLMPDVKWDVIVDSSKVGLKKPDVKIYEFAQELVGRKGKEILFIENGPNNSKAAKDFGWNVFFYDSSNHENSCKELSDYLNKLK